MRNLKKILALVLALVMSLSLMATAGATEFPDDDKISDTYRTAAEVLNQLNVFAGDQNGNFNPTDPIRRSEVAAILYRIGTGDVGVEGHKTYAPYNQFKDVQAEDWYAGYVTYCANAGWIKGRSNNDFDPNANVTGYEVLAMILRAVGYDKNNEFVGSNWQLNTASIAREKGVLVNVLKDPSVQLSQPATREVVAELLFRAALLPQVTWNAATLSYVDGGETLGMVNFGLEDVSGVVVANEWANIVDDGAKVLADGTTQLKLADNTLYTVNKSTELEAVGQEYSAYVADSTDGSRTKRALTLEPSGRSVVATNDGKSVNVASLRTSETHANAGNDQGFPSIAAMAAGQGISSLGSAPYYLNYSLSYRDWETSDILIRYAVAKVSVDGYTNVGGGGGAIYGPDGVELPTSSGNGSWKNYIQTLKNDNNKPDSAKTYPGHSVEERNIRVNWDANGDHAVNTSDVLTCYVVAIAPEYNAPTSSGAANWIDTEINPTDIAIMRDIFYTADRLGSNTTGLATSETQNYVYGEVYTGTSSLTDESDTLSWPQFTEKYFKTQDTVTYQGCGNGNSLRVIDTDGNGVADYIFKVTYAQDEAIGTYRDALEFYTLAPGSNTVWDGGVESYAVGDVVNYRTIDGKTTIWKAEKVTDVVNDKHFNNITVTLASDGDRGQSDIVNNTGMDDNIMTMNDRVEYNVYLDQFGFIRTFELAQGSNYALVTEIYNTNNQAYNYVNTNNWIAEIKAGSADVEEYTISNARNNPFITNYAWTTRNTRYYNGADLNFMQPAIAHLGAIPGDALAVQFMGATKGQTPEYWQFTGSWNRGIFAMDPVVSALNASGANANSIRANGQTDYGVFNYGAVDYTADQQYHESGVGVAGTAAGSFSFTNVAQYTLDGDTVALSTAAKLATDRNGEQLYRVGYDPNTHANGVEGSSLPNTTGKTLVFGFVGTKDELVNAWIHDNTQTDGSVDDSAAYVPGTTDSVTSTATAINAAAQTWWNNNYSGSTTTNVAKNGTKIYPVYLNDYIQLDLNNAVQGATINSTTRHYNISANYNTFYNTNSNTYVNAVADTEFYVVMPDRVLYCESYADLPAIATGTIRAAYAVATNTQANTSGQDYWVADVIVIETTNLVSTYQSVSLMYYNPWINSSSVRYVNSLNNQWRTYEGVEDANVTVVPEYSDGGSYVWGNQSWQTGSTMATSDYGFYALYDTEYADGNLTAYDARKIEGDWNKNHIFAGTIRRLTTASKDPTYSLAASNYMDVDIQGRGANLLNDDQYVIPVGIREVPIYRVTANSANQIRLNQIGGGDVTVNDEIIWVTDMSGNVSYIIDLGARQGYTRPAYLINGTTGIYDLVKAEQIQKINDDTIYYDTVTIDVNLAAGETLTISGTGLQNTVTAGSATFAGGTVTTTLNINRALPAVDLTLSLRDAAGNYKPIAMVVHIGPVAGAWSIGGLQLNNDAETYTLRLVNGTVRPRSADALTSAINLIVYSEARIDELITDSAKAIGTGEGEITLAEAQAVQAELTAISAVLDGRITIEGNPVDTDPVVPSAEDVEDVPAEMTPPANAGEIQGEVDTAKDGISDAVTEASWTVSVTDEHAKITVSPTAVVKGSSLNSVVLTLSVKDSYTLPDTVSINMGEPVNAEKYTYNKAAGTITFKADCGLTATANIVITANSVAPAPTTYTVTVSDTTNLQVTPTTVTKDAAVASLTISLKTGVTGKVLPDTVAVSVGGTNVPEGQVSYDKDSGVITLTNVTATGNIVVTATAGTAPADTYTVTVSDSENLEVTPTTVNKDASVSSLTIKVKTGVTGKVLPTTVTVSVGGTNVPEGQVSYDKDSGVITLTNVTATGNIVVTATAADDGVK